MERFGDAGWVGWWCATVTRACSSPFFPTPGDDVTLQTIGVFQETNADQSSPSIHDSIGTLPENVREVVANYLDAGVSISAVMGLVPDVLAGPECILSRGESTDGIYVWRRSLAHYVRKYGVGVPDDLVERALSGGRLPAELSPEGEDVVRNWLRDGHYRGW